MARIKVIKYNEATGKLKEIYDELVSKRGKLANVLTIQSLKPESITTHINLYMDIMFTKSELSRAEREMMAVVVSVANKCSYCQIHHAEAVNHYWKNENKLNLLKSDFRKADLTPKELALCIYAEEVTLNPGNSQNQDSTLLLKKERLSDNAILDATLVVSYFNFVNRMVLALDVKLESDSGTGYKY